MKSRTRRRRACERGAHKGPSQAKGKKSSKGKESSGKAPAQSSNYRAKGTEGIEGARRRSAYSIEYSRRRAGKRQREAGSVFGGEGPAATSPSEESGC